MKPALFKAVSFLFLFFLPTGGSGIGITFTERAGGGGGGGRGEGGQRVRECIEIWRLTRAVLTKLATNLAG